MLDFSLLIISKIDVSLLRHSSRVDQELHLRVTLVGPLYPVVTSLLLATTPLVISITITTQGTPQPGEYRTTKLNSCHSSNSNNNQCRLQEL